MMLLDDKLICATMMDTIDRAVAQDALPDYVYSYPPRQTFRAGLEGLANDGLIGNFLASDPENFNLYLHFPFCKQICGFCNLYSVGRKSDAVVAQYIEALIQELKHYAALIPPMHCRTLYFGGGTPSLLRTEDLEFVLQNAESIFPGSVSSSEEICIEVAPDTLDNTRANDLQSIGFTRVSLGVQSLNDYELRTIGRNHKHPVAVSAIESAIKAGIRDVCVDLIIGLPGQNEAAWRNSVRSVIELRPPTICTYHLTLRPATGFSRRKISPLPNTEHYSRYEYSQAAFLSAGYVQETNVRYILKGVGGYRQKVNHWRGGTILGVGAGARTYCGGIHYNNGYSSAKRQPVFDRYLQSVSENGHSRREGFVLNDDERLRQRLILGTDGMNLGDLEALFLRTGLGDFRSFVEYYTDGKYATLRDGLLEYTPRGYMYRDIAVNCLFSSAVRDLIGAHDYTA